MGRSKGTQQQKCQNQTRFASKHQKSAWPPTSCWTLVCLSSPSPNWSTSASKEDASALEQLIANFHNGYLDCESSEDFQSFQSNFCATELTMFPLISTTIITQPINFAILLELK